MSDYAVTETALSCPYCGELISVLVDTTGLNGTDDEYVEDCQVCCRRIRIQVSMAADGSIELQGLHENDT